MEMGAASRAISTGLLSPTSCVNRLVCWQIIYVQELLKAYSPLLYQALFLAFSVANVPAILESLTGLFDSSDYTLDSINEEDIVESSRSLEEYSTFVDDKQVRGDTNDIDRLEEHGYDKFRHLSSSFLERMGGEGGRGRVLPAGVGRPAARRAAKRR